MWSMPKRLLLLLLVLGASGQTDFETKTGSCSLPTPQAFTLDSNDWTRMRKGGWWLRRGIRFDAMRYWYQYSDFARFPGLQRFSNVAELLCMSMTLDGQAISEKMRRHNEKTLVHSASFWVHAIVELM